MMHSKLAQKNKATNPETYEACRSRLIEEKVARRYSPTEEIAILRQRDTKPQKYQEYYDFVEKCISEADAELAGGTNA